MRYKDPELMKEIHAFVNDYFRSERRSPSVNDVAKAVGIAKTTAYRYLVDMNERGIIAYDGSTITTPQTGKCISGYFSAPIVGSIRCGNPELEEECIEEYISLPVSVFGNGQDCYMLRAEGDSMVDVGIAENDLLLIHRQHTAAVGDVVVALDGERQNTLKTFAGIDIESGCAVLKYENRKEYPGKQILVNELEVQGVVTHIIKAMK
ncbi:MAG: repressor LexA [Ruminococcaceae bacterium]|nr:repressor LexA [Oscillospiraceae bacterium]